VKAHKVRYWWWRRRGWRCSRPPVTRGRDKSIGSYDVRRSCRPTDSDGRTALNTTENTRLQGGTEQTATFLSLRSQM